MQPQPVKLTTAQLWLVHTLETLFFSAIVAGGIAVYQALSLGTFDWRILVGIAAAVIFAVLSKGWSATIQKNANVVPALMDTLSEIQAAVLQQPTTLPIPVQQGPLVVVHTAQPPPDVPSPGRAAVPPRPTVQPPVQPRDQPQEMAAPLNIAERRTIPVPVVPQVSFPDRSFSQVMPTVPGSSLV